MQCEQTGATSHSIHIFYNSHWAVSFHSSCIELCRVSRIVCICLAGQHRIFNSPSQSWLSSYVSPAGPYESCPYCLHGGTFTGVSCICTQDYYGSLCQYSNGYYTSEASCHDPPAYMCDCCMQWTGRQDAVIASESGGWKAIVVAGTLTCIT